MRYAIVPTLVVCLLNCSSGQAQEAAAKNERHEDIRRLLELTDAVKLAEQSVDHMIAQFRATLPAPAEFWDEFRNELSTDSLVEELIVIYEKHLSAEDVKALIVFYESPLGRRLIEAQPRILADSMAAGQQWGQEAGMRAMERLQEQNAK